MADGVAEIGWCSPAVGGGREAQLGFLRDEGCVSGVADIDHSADHFAASTVYRVHHDSFAFALIAHQDEISAIVEDLRFTAFWVELARPGFLPFE